MYMSDGKELFKEANRLSASLVGKDLLNSDGEREGKSAMDGKGKS